MTRIVFSYRFTKLHQGKYPLGLQNVELPNKLNKNVEIEAAARRLLKEDINSEMNSEMLNGLEEEEGDEDGKKRSRLKNKQRSAERKKVDKDAENINTWKVCDVVKKKSDVKEVVNRGWIVSILDTSAMKGVKRKHGSEINKSSGKFIITELNLDVETCERKNKRNLDTGSNALQKQVTPESVSNISTETYSVSIQNENCNSESVCTAQKQNNASKKLKQNSPKKDKIQENVKYSLQVNGLKISKVSQKANGNVSKSNISDWGGEWDIPLENGDIEVIIPSELPCKKQKQQHTPSESRVGSVNEATQDDRLNVSYA